MHGAPEGVAEADDVPTRENVLLYLIERSAVPPESEATELLRAFAQLQAPDLDVARAAEQLEISRRTLSRRFRAAHLPAPKQWLALARALHAHRVILRGGCLKHAAITAGYADQFTMSNAIFRITGLRPTAMRTVGWQRFVDIWIKRQQDRGTLPRQHPPIHSTPRWRSPMAGGCNGSHPIHRGPGSGDLRSGRRREPARTSAFRV